MSLKHRRVFLARNVEQARSAVMAALSAGVLDDDIAVIARADIEIRHVHERRKNADSDFMPAAKRGAGIGATVGLLVSLPLLMVFGLPLWGALAGIVIGALVGMWASALVGASIPDPIRRKFAEEIEAGHVLVVVDAEDPTLDAAQTTVEGTGATLLPYDAPSVLS